MQLLVPHPILSLFSACHTERNPSFPLPWRTVKRYFMLVATEVYYKKALMVLSSIQDGG
jgi:hypothetical protein